MKKLLPIVLCISLCLPFSCSKDDSTTSNSAALSGTLEGSWRVSSYSYDGYFQVIDVEEVTTESFYGNGWEMFLTLTFNSNNEYTITGPYRLDHVVVDVDGNETFYTGNFQWSETGTWSRDGSKITLNDTENIKNGDILILDDANLSLILRSSISEANSEGYQETLVRNETFEFSRVL